ncbi:hypothetical protein [Haematobacter missouriensis]|uniref:hypothetical protein n=1 Tax=Haematobacter missouriensis TaxID=366616 RepID=UPI00117B537F|nr:hypothetical protein [Haematobacter missouriensis]
MLFDVQAALSEILATTRATIATPATNRPNVAKVADVAVQRAENPASAPVLPFTPSPSAPAPSRDDDDMFRHGRSIAGNPVTWTGRIVRLDDWRQLSVWGRHGPDGRLFCGICRAWVQPDSFPHCHDGNGGAA